MKRNYVIKSRRQTEKKMIVTLEEKAVALGGVGDVPVSSQIVDGVEGEATLIVVMDRTRVNLDSEEQYDQQKQMTDRSRRGERVRWRRRRRQTYGSGQGSDQACRTDQA